MKKNKKILLIISLFIIIIAIILLKYYQITKNTLVKEQDDGTKVNVSQEFAKEREFEGLTINNTQLIFKENRTEMKLTIKNNTDSDSDLKLVTIKLLDKNKNEVGKLNGIISGIKSGEEVPSYIISSVDYSNVYSYEIESR